MIVENLKKNVCPLESMFILKINPYPVQIISLFNSMVYI